MSVCLRCCTSFQAELPPGTKQTKVMAFFGFNSTQCAEVEGNSCTTRATSGLRWCNSFLLNPKRTIWRQVRMLQNKPVCCSDTKESNGNWFSFLTESYSGAKVTRDGTPPLTTQSTRRVKQRCWQPHGQGGLVKETDPWRGFEKPTT